MLPVGAALLTACGNAAKHSKDTQDSKKPNVIYLISDDLGIGDLSCYGATKSVRPTSTASPARDCSSPTPTPLRRPAHLPASDC